ncbi:hypothetical protein LTR08_008113 [Meristemomyces frigidus]|nr:hypothetical protein LTR08_008113 [Meristemomyces frigidus]
MALQLLSVGDVIMLSQTAWKIGRAFTQGRKSAPSEFSEVENEANGLSDALKLVAETLFTNDSLLSRAEPETRAAISTILESARKTLDDLESFVERYQVINKKGVNGGFVVEKTWSEVVMANYKTFKWTTEGGNITDLRNMLQMHTNTINLVMQALQSKSLTRLERTVMPMADRVASIHERVNGDLADKINDLHRWIMAVANSTPAREAMHCAIGDTSNVYSSSIYSTDTRRELSPSTNESGRIIEAPPPRTLSFYSLPMSQPDRRESQQSRHSSKKNVRSEREDSACYTAGLLAFKRDGEHMDRDFESGSPPDRNGSVDDDGVSKPTSSPSCLGTSPSKRNDGIARRDSTTLPSSLSTMDQADTRLRRSRDTGTPGISPISRSPLMAPTWNTNARQSSKGMHVFTPPAVPPKDGHQRAATPSNVFDPGTRSNTNDYNKSPEAQIATTATTMTTRQGWGSRRASPGSPTVIESPAFEKRLFRNSAILCDVRAKTVEYAQHIPDEPDSRFDTEMVEACKEARICVIRKRENREHGGTRVVTSIWILSDDGEVRCQQKLSDANETVPYCSYFDALKVSLPPTDGAILLNFHAAQWGDAVRDQKKTNWVNYVFVSESDAMAFQSAVFGRTLIGSYRTTKTTVIHDGLKGAFAFEEQFANIEILRLWEDDGLSTPGAAGGVIALLHVSSNFGDGWARWWINSSKQQVQVREDGTKYAKVKGIDVTVVRPSTSSLAADKSRKLSTTDEGLHRVETRLDMCRPQGSNRTQVKRVTGIRIEFKTEEERAAFVSASKRVQQRTIALPDF